MGKLRRVFMFLSVCGGRKLKEVFMIFIYCLERFFCWGGMLRSCDRGYLVCKDRNIYVLVFYRKCGLIIGVESDWEGGRMCCVRWTSRGR